MDLLPIGILGIVFLFILLLLGVHIGISLAVVAFIGSAVIFFLKNGDIVLSLTLGGSVLTSAFMATAINFVFIVLPLFILMGVLAAEGGMSYSAYRALLSWVGRLPGGLGIATIGGQTGFGTCTGSSFVTALVFARISTPEMISYGYQKRFAYGLVTAGGAIGMLIPPSVLMIVYGLLSDESIGKLLIAGVGPGIALALIFSLGIITLVKLNPSLAPTVKTRYSWREKLASLKDLWPISVVAIVVIGGIMGGLFTASEAGATGAFIVFVVGLVTGKLKIRALPLILSETAQSTAMVFLIFISALSFSRFLSLSGIARAMMDAIGSLEVSAIYIIIGFLFLYFFLGMFLDAMSMLATTVPIIHPIIKSLGVDPIWFALLAIMAIECGFLTPPVGLTVYAVKGVAGDDITLEDLFKGSFPFFLMMIFNLILLIIFPSVVTWLPSLAK